MKPCPIPRCNGDNGNPVVLPDNKPACEYHLTRIEHALNEYRTLYLQLAQQMVPGSGRPDGRHSPGFGSKTPINDNARALQNDMLNVIRKGETQYRHNRGWATYPRRGREINVITVGARFLANTLEPTLTIDIGVGIEILRIKNAARVALGLTRLFHRLPAPCPECDTMALRREDGASWVECVNCGLNFNEKAYGVLVRVLADANR